MALSTRNVYLRILLAVVTVQGVTRSRYIETDEHYRIETGHNPFAIDRHTTVPTSSLGTHSATLVAQTSRSFLSGSLRRRPQFCKKISAENPVFHGFSGGEIWPVIPV